MAELIDFGSKITYSSDSPMRWGSEQAISGANKIRDFNRQRAVENAISKNYNPETQTLDEQSLGKQLAAQGFGGTAEQVINQFKADRTKMSSDVADAIQKDTGLVMQGIMSPQRFAEKWGKTQEVSTTTTNPVSPVTKPTIPDIVAEKFPTSFGYTKKDEIPFTSKFGPSSEQPSDGYVVTVPGNDFVSKAEEAKLQDIIPTTEYKITTKEPSTTTGYLAISNAPKLFSDFVSGSSVETQSTTSTAGMTDDEKLKLKTFLARENIDTKNLSLEQAITEYENRSIQTATKPVPPIKGNLDDLLRYQKEIAEYNAKVAENLKTARKEMRGAVGEIQGTDIQSAAEKRAEQKYRSEMQRVLHPLVFDPSKDPPTQAGADRVFDIVINFDDIRRAGESTGDASKDFQRAWQAAVAKGKIDKNTTLENIVSNLVAMGAMPDRQAAIVKKMLETSVDWQTITADKVAQYFAKNDDYFGFKPKGADPDWVDQQRKTYSVDLKLNNAYPLEQIESKLYTASKPKSGAKATADGITAKAKESAAKKGATSSKPNTPKPPRLDD